MRKLGRSTDHRIAMLRAMVTYLFENGKIETTVTRAKEVSAMAEKMITLAKVGDLHARKTLQRSLLTKLLLSMLIATAATPRSSRPVLAAVMLLKWQSSSWFNQNDTFKAHLKRGGLFV